MTAGQIISLLTATISKYPLFSRDVGHTINHWT